MKIDIKSCARCGGDHLQLEHKAFKRPISPPEIFWAWEYWATCPTNGDPILMSVSWAFFTAEPPEVPMYLPRIQ